MNTDILYKEEDLLKSINGNFIVEAYRCKRIQNTVIGLCTNSYPMFCRRQDNVPDSDYSWMEVLTPSSSILKHDNIEEKYNACCPKIAWGIAAYLYYYSNEDERGNVYFIANKKAVTLQSLFSQYYNLNKERYSSFNKGYYLRCQSMEKTDEFDREFIEFHIKEEKSISKSFIPDDLTKISKEYIEWLNRNYEEFKTKDSAPLSELFKAHTPIAIRKAFIDRIKDKSKGYEIIAEILSLQSLGYIRDITKKQIRQLIIPYTKWDVRQSAFDSTFSSSKITKRLKQEIEKFYSSLK